MNELQIFQNEEFGEIRTVEQDGKVLFCGTDIATALGYAIPHKAVREHTKGGLKRTIPTAGGNQEVTFIPEGDVYRLMSCFLKSSSFSHSGSSSACRLVLIIRRSESSGTSG